MNRRTLLTGLLSGLALLSLAPAPRPAGAEAPAVVVLAASSLTETLNKVARAWTARGHPRVTLSFDASSRLAKQIEAGAPADAFFSADEAWMDYLAGKGLIDPATRANLLGNRLVAVLPKRSALQVAGASDLGRPEIGRLALAGENVPAGRYARAALTTLGAWEPVRERVVSGDNVRAVLSWVARGEADAGVVYATDARVEPAVKLAFTFPVSSHPAIVYPAAVVQGSARAADAADFIRYCRSAEGMAVFLAAGFTAPPTGP